MCVSVSGAPTLMLLNAGLHLDLDPERLREQQHVLLPPDREKLGITWPLRSPASVFSEIKMFSTDLTVSFLPSGVTEPVCLPAAALKVASFVTIARASRQPRGEEIGFFFLVKNAFLTASFRV